MRKRTKLLLLLICVPYYPIGLIGEWYEAKGDGRQFNLKEYDNDYWEEVQFYLAS